MAKRKKPEPEPDVLKSWNQIATFLGQPVSVAQRWATEGMPVKRQGGYVESSRKELNGGLDANQPANQSRLQQWEQTSVQS